METVTSTCTSGITTQTLSLDNRNNIRDVSFSSYLNGAEQTFFLLKLNDSTNTQHDQNKIEDAEIGVFAAEKYFQGEMDKPNPRIEHKNHITFSKPKTQLTTPSVRSELSWNSQSMLLHNNVPGKHEPTKSNKRKSRGKSFLSNLTCRCYCNNKKSVDTDDDQIVKKIGTRELPKQPTRSRDFIFPVLCKPMKSGVDHDNESDASSDLFELESLSTNNGITNPYLSRQASDAMSGCYAPSEASIEWSVATASAADFSVVSDWEEIRTTPGKDNQRRTSGVLLGCKSQKAVNVAGNVCKKNEPHGAHTHGLEFHSLKAVKRFEGESKLSGYRFQRGRYASHLLYIQ